MQRDLFALAILLAIIITAGCQLPVYTVKSISRGQTAINGNLELTSGKGPYGADVRNLKFVVAYEKDDRVRIVIGDSEEKRWRVPDYVIPGLKVQGRADQSNLVVEIPDQGKQFNIKISRRNGQVLFDTTGKDFVFEDQYLVLSTAFTSPHEPNIYGLGERVNALRLDPRDNHYTIWPQDNGNLENFNLYGHHPFYLDQRNDGTAHGLFFLNSNALEFNMKYNKNENRLQIRAIGGIMDLTIFAGPHPQQVVQQYHDLIGRPAFVPYWSLGFHQCKWGYDNINNTIAVVENYKKNDLPLDTIWNDIDYMQDLKDFTFHNKNFEHERVKKFISDLHANGQHYIVIVDPGIKVEKDYAPYEIGLQKGVYIFKEDGKTPIKNKVWPGITVFPDFTNPKSHEYWSDLINEWLDEFPLDGIWIDMNELATFCDGECESDANDISTPYLPPGLKLNKQQLNMNSVMNASTWYNAHSFYAFMEGYATRKALLRKYPNKRPVIISRSSFAGTGRYNSHWLGDNDATYRSMHLSIPGMLTFNMFGIPLVGADICGFNGDTNAQLCARWTQLGSFYPFSRNHNSIGKIPQESYVFGPRITDINRSALKNRYQLLPYYYTLFYKAHVEGSTVVRPLFFEFPTVVDSFVVDTQFMVGSALLVSPALEENQTVVDALIPPGRWFDYYNGTEISGNRRLKLFTPLEKIHVHVRGGAIVPRQQDALNTAQQKKLPHNLLVALDENGNAGGELYLDDGESVDAVSTGRYTLIKYKASFDQSRYTLESHVDRAGYDNGVLGYVSFVGLKSKATKVTVNGSAAKFRVEEDKLTVDCGNSKLTKDLKIVVSL
ncbi:lysosomal alpha-glucosidase [Acrasis kona]|uniref:alpha-glucosidase n=1 Tax=Acrasis kona TaxID=1008807 RepID=A0AAW2YMN1_9EUKA